MSRLEWLARMAFGWVCYQVWNPLPLRLQSGRVGMWLLPHVGFYAFDDGYASYSERATSTVQDISASVTQQENDNAS